MAAVASAWLTEMAAVASSTVIGMANLDGGWDMAGQSESGATRLIRGELHRKAPTPLN